MTTTEDQLNPTSVDNQILSWSTTIDRLKLQQRICSVFIPQEINKDYCVCNRHRSTHRDQNLVDRVNEVWNWKKHSKVIDATCYGTLSQSNSPYLRCDIKTDLDQLCLVLLGEWTMHIPKLILRIVNNSNCLLNIKLERELLRGIADAAKASDACIITSCYKEDTISQLIGEVIYKSRVKNPEINFKAIGVGKWGNIRDRPRKKEKDNNNETTTTTTTQEHKSGKKTLEPNLTHYIFFDDGTRDSMDTGQFASALAKQISRGARRKIPLVTTVVGSDLHALELVFNDLKNQVPVVIVDQSGPFANIMCKYLKSTEHIFKSTKARIQEATIHEESDCEDGDDDLDAHMLHYSFDKTTLREVLCKFGSTRLEILKDLRKLYGYIRQEEYAAIGKKFPVGQLLNTDEERTLAKYVYWFATCLSLPFRNQIYVFAINSSTPFQNKIYEALIQARQNLSQTTNKRAMTVDDQIHLALRWSITDISEDNLISNTTDWNDSKKVKQNRRLILNALNKNSQVFFSNFFKLGIDFAVVFAPTTDPEEKKHDSSWNRYLKILYFNMRKNTDSLYLLDEINKRRFTFEKEIDLTNILNILVGDFMKPIYEYESSSNKHRVAPKVTENEIASEYIYRDLFLWCVLTHRLEMAKTFLAQMKSRLCSALIASKILKSFVPYAPDQNSKDTLNSEAGDFETYAIECIRCSYFYDRSQACELVMRRVNLYGEVTCLQMAIAADNKKFLYEDACNALLTNIWYDKEDPEQDRTLLVINLLTMGISQFFISAYEKHYDEKQTKSSIYSQTPAKPCIERPLAKNGINYTDDYHTNQSIFTHFSHFHNRPIVKYCYTCFGYILFLLFFSYYMLFAFDPPSEDTPVIHWTEILTIIFVTTMLFEEFRQFFFQDSSSLKSKLLTYFDWTNRFSNLCLVVPAYLLFYIGLVLRFVIHDPVEFAAARIVMAYDLELWFIRSILFIGIAPSLGPKLVMIRKMTNDLLFFVFLILIVIFGYGITSRAMTAYGTIDFDGREFFIKIVYPVYYFVLGSFDDERTKLDETPDAGTTIATQVMFAFHMLFVNILLVNLLIALFTFTIDNVQEQAKYIWAYDRCALIRDYYARPALFPPFTFLISIADFCQWYWKKCRPGKNDTRCFKMIPRDASIDNAWSEFERYSTNDYVRRLLDVQVVDASPTMATGITSEVLPTSNNDSKRHKADLDQLDEAIRQRHFETDDRLSSMESTISILNDRVQEIDNRFDKVIESLDWMMRAMTRVKMANEDPPSIKPKPRTSVSQQEQQRVDDNTQNNRLFNRSSSQYSRRPTPAVPDIRILLQDKSNIEEE